MTPYLEIGGDYRQVLPGVHLVELPLPFSLGLVNVYLIRLSEGYMLVDCGMDTTACQEAMARAVEGIGCGWSGIRQVLVTHMHPDHAGLAYKVLEWSGAQLLMSAEEADLLAALAGAQGRIQPEHDLLVDGGVAPDMIANIEFAFAGIRKTMRSLTPDRRMAGGETIPAAAGTLEVLLLRGHSRGHLCLYGAERRVLFSGDQILQHITPNIGWQPDHDALGEFLASLDRLEALEIDLILPSHGAPFSGHREWIRETRRHHAERCAQIEASLAAEPKTAHELVGDLWNRKLSQFHHRFAVFEVMAHLEYLQQRERLGSRREDGALHWRLI